jgi:threonine dehydrogenase-like Zn-dependent dehydrogenase
MRALVWDGATLRYEADRRPPAAGDGSALLRVRLAGICSTDLQILKGYMGFRGVPGHELVGQVEEGPDDLVGRRVVAEINFACGRCSFCENGLGRHCPARQVMGILGADGAFAEWVAAPSANLHPLPDELSDEAAVFAEPLAAAFEILEQVKIKRGDKALVLGDGKLGLLCAQVLRLAGAAVTLVGRHAEKLAIARDGGVRTALLSDWRTESHDVVVEATGDPSAMALAVRNVRPRGTLVLKSTVAAEHRLSLAEVVINEITVVGSRCGPFPPALDALTKGEVCVTRLIERVYPLAQGLAAVGHAGRRGARKILLRP